MHMYKNRLFNGNRLCTLFDKVDPNAEQHPLMFVQ